MVHWILAVLGLFVLQTLLPASIRYLFAGSDAGSAARSAARVSSRLKIALGPRDEQPPLSPIGGRAQRALDNMHEALPVFLTLAFLNVLQNGGEGSATLGAAIFFVARAIYVPAYLSGISGLRSIVWMVSWGGLALMIEALV